MQGNSGNHHGWGTEKGLTRWGSRARGGARRRRLAGQRRGRAAGAQMARQKDHANSRGLQGEAARVAAASMVGRARRAWSAEIRGSAATTV
jgi:hypothetical protein